MERAYADNQAGAYKPTVLPLQSPEHNEHKFKQRDGERACAAERGGHNDAQGERENGDMYACDRSDNTCVPVLPEILCSGTYGRRGQGVKY